MAQDLWGKEIVNSGDFHVYHDESETKPNKEWFLIGLLFVPSAKLREVGEVLKQCREKEKYYGEVHYSELPKSFSGEWGGKARLAEKWLCLYKNGLFQYANFSCLVINRNSPSYNHHRFSQEFHAYNRFTAMALKAGIAWHLTQAGYDRVQLIPVSDGKDRRSRPDQGLVDNFEDYVPMRVELDNWLSREVLRKNYPKVMMSRIKTLSSKENDLLQLTDLLLGAFQCALVCASGRQTKLKFANMIAEWYEDSCKKPWEQRFKMHRKFSAWGFPDIDGKPYKDIKLKIFEKADKKQLELDFEQTK